MGGIKAITFIGSALLAAVLITSSMSFDLFQLTPAGGESTLASVPMKYTYFPDVGNVASPHLETTIETPTKSVPITFLIDSGAKITALPMKYVDELGLDTTKAKRIYLRSATNNTTYGYLAEIDLKLNQTTVKIPVAFAEVIEPLLGTFGFFDRFTVLFDATTKQVYIKDKL